MVWLFICSLTLIIAMIIWSKGVKRATWLFIGVFFFNDLIEITPFNSYALYTTAFVISLWIHDELKQEWQSFPFKYELLTIFVFHIGIAITDQRINHDILKVCSRIFNNFMTRYMALFVGYATLQSLKNWRKTIIALFCTSAVMGIYGIITWLLQSNPYYNMMHVALKGKSGIWTDVQNRGYRVLSTLSNPIVYGYVMCIVGHLVLLWKKYINITLWACLMLLILSNILFSNSRTSIVAGLILAIVFLLFKYKLSLRMYKYIVLCIAMLAVSYFTIPVVRNVSDSIMDLFTSGGTNTVGSTVDLKFEQLKAAVYFFLKHPLWGNGFNFFEETIKLKHIAYEGNLAGLEGFAYKLLVEEGAFMIIAVVVLFVNLLRYFINRSYLGDYAYVGIAWVLSFLAFMLLAGCWGGIFTIGMLFIGLLLKFIQYYEILYIDTCIQCRAIHKEVLE